MSKSRNRSGVGHLKVAPEQTHDSCTSKQFCDGVVSLARCGEPKGLGFDEYFDTENMEAVEYLTYRTQAGGEPYMLGYCPVCGTDLYALYLSDGRMETVSK